MASWTDRKPKANSIVVDFYKESNDLSTRSGSRIDDTVSASFYIPIVWVWAYIIGEQGRSGFPRRAVCAFFFLLLPTRTPGAGRALNDISRSVKVP